MRQKGPPHYCNSAGFNEVGHILVRSVPPADMEGFETFTNWLSTRYSLPIWISIMPRHELECCMVLAKEIGGGGQLGSCISPNQHQRERHCSDRYLRTFARSAEVFKSSTHLEISVPCRLDVKKGAHISVFYNGGIN